MAGRERSTKARAQRIDRQYFRRTFSLQRWRWILAGAAIAAGLGWLAFHLLGRNETVYSAGDLNPAHAMLNKNCGVCHVRTGAFTARVSDRACSACHSGAIHQARQTFTPQCVDCHQTHTGKTFTTVSDRECTVCHANLQVKSGELKVAAHIRSFDQGHPEFALERNAIKDPGAIKFNHAFHMKKDLRAVKGNVTIACADCHRAANREAWPWGVADVVNASAVPSNDRRYMEPVNYYQHCAACHPLTFDRRFAEAVPHKEPAVVHDFVVKKFTEWIAAHPEELREPRNQHARIPRSTPAALPNNAAAWVSARVDESEALLRVKTCKECHAITPADHGIPAIDKARITARWMEHAEFDHSAHQMLLCETCHDKARTSRKTSDLLLPGIQVCRDCHISGRQDAARADCAECHVYHDPAKRKHVDGTLTLKQISAVR